MLWPFILHSTFWLGFELSNVLMPKYWDWVDIIAIGVPLGITIVSWAYFIARILFVLSAGLGLFITLISYGICLILRIRIKLSRPLRDLRQETVFMLLLSFVLFVSLCDASYLRNGTTSSATTMSDLPFHMSLITSMAFGANSKGLKMITPFYAGEKLCYPFIPDFFSSVLISCGGASIRVSVALPSLFVLMCVVLSVHSIAIYFSSKRYVGELAVMFWFLASGDGWKYQFKGEYWRNPNINAAHSLGPKHTFWIQTLIHYLLPQRSGLFSSPLAIYSMRLLIEALLGKTMKHKTILAAGLLHGMLPMISAHSFIAIGEYAIFLCLITFPYMQLDKWKKYIVYWCFYGIPAVLLAIPQVLFLIQGHRASKMFSISPIWNETDRESRAPFIRMWWESLSGFVFVSLLAVWTEMDFKQIQMYVPSVCIFIISNFIRYQPGAMDNNKVFYVTWLPLASSAFSLFCIKITHKKILRKVLVASLAIGTTASSVICIWKALAVPFNMYEPVNRDFGIWAQTHTHPEDVFLTSSYHTYSPMTFAGRIVTMGYGGWVWTHGLDYRKRIDEMKEIIKDRENISKLADLGIRYALARPDDNTRDFSFPTPGPSSRWMEVLVTDRITLYKYLHTL